MVFSLATKQLLNRDNKKYFKYIFFKKQKNEFIKIKNNEGIQTLQNN